MGDFDEANHPRASDGKFTDGAAGEHGTSTSARAATTRAAKAGHKVDAKKPTSNAPAEAHSSHAASLRGVALQHVNAAAAHTEASKIANANGDHKAAVEHAEAAKVHADEARERSGEAKEHSALARVNGDHDVGHAQEHREANTDVAHAAHDAGDHAVAAHDDAQHAKEHDKEHEGHGEREHDKEKGGLAEWVKGKIEGAKEGIAEKGEAGREITEKAIEEDPYKAAVDVAGGAAKAVAGGGEKKEKGEEKEGEHE